MTSNQPATDFSLGSTRHLLGTLVTLRGDADATDGAFSLVEIRVAPGAGTPAHHHEDAEAFYVLEGEVTFSLNGHFETKHPTDFVFIRSGTVHAFQNTTGRAATMLGINLPGGPHQSFFAQAGDPAESATAFPPMSAPDIPRLMESAGRNGITILPPGS